jgi:hypothetical protein
VPLRGALGGVWIVGIERWMADLAPRDDAPPGRGRRRASIDGQAFAWFSSACLLAQRRAPDTSSGFSRPPAA